MLLTRIFRKRAKPSSEFVSPFHYMDWLSKQFPGAEISWINRRDPFCEAVWVFAVKVYKEEDETLKALGLKAFGCKVAFDLCDVFWASHPNQFQYKVDEVKSLFLEKRITFESCVFHELTFHAGVV